MVHFIHLLHSLLSIKKLSNDNQICVQNEVTSNISNNLTGKNGFYTNIYSRWPLKF